VEGVTATHELVVERTLARRLEGALVADVAAFVAGMAAGDPGGGAARRAVADGWAAFTGHGLFANRVEGVGLAGDHPGGPDDGLLDAVEHHYAALGLPAEYELCPLADAAWWRALGARGYRLASFRNVYVRALDDLTPAVAALPGPEVATEVVDEASFPAWSAVLLDGFGYEPGPERDRVAGWNAMLATRPEFALVLARIDGEPVGAANVAVHGELASLGGTTTLVARRRQGVQRGLLAARLRHARAAGATLAVITADPGGTSARNIERHGFRLAYTNARLRAPAG